MCSGTTERKASSSSWRALRAPYFERVCHRVLDAPMLERAFGVHDSSNLHVLYASGERFLECSYYVEDHPNYALMINIGFLHRRADGQFERDGVGAWRLLRDVNASEKSNSWVFSDEPSLSRLLSRLYSQVIEPIALPLLTDTGRLSAVLDAQRLELDDSATLAVESRHLASARHSYAAGRYGDAVRFYEAVDPRRMLASDSKKLESARRRCQRPS